jgi:Family of unknown function (DUF6502)
MMAVSGLGLSGDARKQLLFAVRRVLRPIVRLLIRVGVSYEEFLDVARGAYVESAIRDRSAAAPLTREGIAFATGVSRQQVDYYIDNAGAMPAVAPTLARVVTEVLHRWHTDPTYLGPYGIPLELEFDSPQGRCIQSLVSQADPTASSGQVLEELLRAGSVTPSGEKHYRAIARWFIIPERLSPQRIEYFGEALTHLALTLEHNFNLADTESKRLERFVFADRGLPLKLLPNFEAFARDRTNRFLLDVDEWLAHSVGTDLNTPDPRVEAGVNVFLYVEPPLKQRSLASLVQTTRDWSYQR